MPWTSSNILPLLRSLATMRCGKVTNAFRLSPDEVIYIPDSVDRFATSRRSILRPEQKGMKVIQVIVGRFIKPGDIVLDSFEGTFATTKVCILLPKHRKFTGGYFSEECMEAALPYVVNNRTSAQPAFRHRVKRCHRLDFSEVLKSTKMLIDTMSRLSARNR